MFISALRKSSETIIFYLLSISSQSSKSSTHIYPLCSEIRLFYLILYPLQPLTLRKLLKKKCPHASNAWGHQPKEIKECWSVWEHLTKRNKEKWMCRYANKQTYLLYNHINIISLHLSICISNFYFLVKS